MRATGSNGALLYETKEVYFKSRKEKRQPALIPDVSGQTAASTFAFAQAVLIKKTAGLTVYDGDVSAFVVLGQR